MINKELIKRWIEALRSGEYQQGRLSLRNISNQFCCLGVLCDIAKDELGLDWVLKEDGNRYEIDNRHTNIPLKIADLIGIDIGYIQIPVDISKLYPGYRNIKRVTLVELNDFYRLSFNQIADILEQQFLS